MERNQLSDMSVFVEVARVNGFRAAAQKLNLGAGSVSEAVQRFEDRLGVRLFDRTTRKIALTSVGEKLYKQSLPAIAHLEAAVKELYVSDDEVSGTLRLNAPQSAGPFFLDAMIADYTSQYPQVDIELIYEDRKIDLVTSGVDAVIRSQTLLEQDSYAIPIGPKLDMAVVATEEYFTNRGRPEHPSDLVDHDGIYFSFGSADRLAPWIFDSSKEEFSVKPKPRMIVNAMLPMIQYAESGLGVAYVYAKTAERSVEKGRLVKILEEYVPQRPRYSLNFLSKRNMPKRLRAFIDLI